MCTSYQLWDETEKPGPDTPVPPVRCGVPRKRPTRIDDVKAWEAECPRDLGKPPKLPMN